jgi:hypothetical protein
MNNITKIWNELTEELVKKQEGDGYLEEINKKFGEIFDIKDVTEYKQAVMVEPFFSPQQFQHLSCAIRRALVEGYILAQVERKKDDIKMLYNCYREDMDKDNEMDDINAPVVDALPRCSMCGDNEPRLPRRKRKSILPPNDK